MRSRQATMGLRPLQTPSTGGFASAKQPVGSKGNDAKANDHDAPVQQDRLSGLGLSGPIRRLSPFRWWIVMSRCPGINWRPACGRLIVVDAHGSSFVNHGHDLPPDRTGRAMSVSHAKERGGARAQNKTAQATAASQP
jgi:hypothetical protein